MSVAWRNAHQRVIIFCVRSLRCPFYRDWQFQGHWMLNGQKYDSHAFFFYLYLLKTMYNLEEGHRLYVAFSLWHIQCNLTLPDCPNHLSILNIPAIGQQWTGPWNFLLMVLRYGNSHLKIPINSPFPFLPARSNSVQNYHSVPTPLKLTFSLDCAIRYFLHTTDSGAVFPYICEKTGEISLLLDYSHT